MVHGPRAHTERHWPRKAMAMHMSLDRNAPPKAPLRVIRSPIDRSTDLLIPFGDSYKYIGHYIPKDLDTVTLQSSITARLRTALNKFMVNDILTHCDLALQRQCLLSELGGAINNILAMAPPGAAFDQRRRQQAQ